MPSDMINVTLAAALRDLIAAQAAANGLTQDTMADALLTAQLATATALVERGESLVEHYLSHPQLAAPSSRASLNIRRATNARAEALAAQASAERGQAIAKGRMIQALLWAAVAPVAADERQPVPPAAPPRAAFTMRIARTLNAALSDLALQRATSREALAAALLDQGFAALAADAALAEILAAQPITASTDSTATLQVPRIYHAPLGTMADQHFGGVKHRALQALLGAMLARAERPAAPAVLPDHTVPVSGPLYARMARLVRAGGSAASVRAFVEQAISTALDAAEASA